MHTLLRFLRASVKTSRLALPKLGVGWMFALLTINFNRITIEELNVAGVAVGTLLAMHYFLSPFQVISGRIADRFPIAGMRRTPYFLLAAVVSSLIFLGLPSAAVAMGDGLVSGYLGAFLLMLGFGVTIAVMGDTHHALIAEVTEARSRGAVISVVWSFTILSTIIAAGVMSSIMPEYDPAKMQELYNLTPFVVIGSALLGLIGIEKRLTGPELAAARAQSEAAAPQGNPITAAMDVLRDNIQARAFFAFIFVAILAIFLQDVILEPFGAEVFDMTPEETNRFQPSWGGGVLIGMALMGGLSAVLGISKRRIALIGCLGTAAGMLLLASAALVRAEALVIPALGLMGLFTGFFNVGALSMMMDMTVEGATGLFMGMWGMAQAFGNGLAAIGGGALHTGLIETGLLSPSVAYFVIFSLEAAGMITAAYIAWHLSVKSFHRIHATRITRQDALRAMESGAVA